MEITVAFIVRGREELLLRCLESIQPIVDEIIIIDCGLDKTLRHTAEAQAQIFPFEWIDDFSRARNFSLSQATKDIILIMDADEIISPADAMAFEEVRKYSASDIWGISLPTRNYLKEDVLDPGYIRNTGDYPDMESSSSGYITSEKVRIFPNRPEIRFENRIHETVEKSILKNKGQITKNSQPVIHHFGYLKKKKQSQKKHRQYEELLKKETEQNPHSLKALFDYAHHLYLAEKHEDSFIFFQRAYDIKPIEKITFYLGILSLKLKRPEKALLFFQNLHDTENPVLLFHKGLAFQDAGQVEQAVFCLKKALRKLPDSLPVMQALTEAHMKAGHSSQAKYFFEKIKKSKPSCKDAEIK